MIGAHRPPQRPRTPPIGHPARGLATSWKVQPWSLRLLRAFLGATFVYAGLQKFLDPNFLHAGTPDYIGEQIHAFARGSPIGPLLTALGHAPTLAGIAIALLEIAVGLGTLLGIAPVLSAATGLGVNLVLFLSATWHIHPYFLGSDSMYAVGWGAYLAGLIEESVAAQPAAHSPRRRASAQDIARRRFLRGAVLAAGSLFVGIAGSELAGRPSSAARSARMALGSSRPGPGRGTGTGGGASSSPRVTGPSGDPIARLDSIDVGSAIPFHDPADGPAILCRLGKDSVAAYSRICTHAGCLVEFDPGSGVLYCPCHGAEFDPRHGARVLGGPAPGPLPSIAVRIDRADGEVLASS